MRYILPLLLILLPLTAPAEIEKIAGLGDADISLYWWPKLTVPPGWHRDEGSSYHYAVNALAPDGRTFVNAEAVMYARALYKPRTPEAKSLEQLIENDKKDVRSHVPGTDIKDAATLMTADGRKLRSLIFIPESEGNWERVSYGEEGDFYVLFTLSARTAKGYQSAEKTYEKLVQSYKEK
jgi:hypothetical protein